MKDVWGRGKGREEEVNRRRSRGAKPLGHGTLVLDGVHANPCTCNFPTGQGRENVVRQDELIARAVVSWSVESSVSEDDHYCLKRRG